MNCPVLEIVSEESVKSPIVATLCTSKSYDIIENDMLVVDFMTQEQCERLIELADNHGNWDSLKYDKFPAQEIRIKEGT